MISPFTYTDYREYLRDYLQERRDRDPKFSHRYMCMKLGLKSSNSMLLVMQGKRNMSQALTTRLSRLLGHDEAEATYFSHVVSFCQAKTYAEKDRHFGSMLNVRRKYRNHTIEQSQYEYYTNWYNPVVLELVCRDDFDGDLERVARAVCPAITRSQVRSSVKLLLRLGLIEEQQGRYVKKEVVLSTGQDIQSLAIVNFHKETARLAAEALDRFCRQERNITSCTLEVPAGAYEAIVQELTQSRKRILDICHRSSPAERIYQLNLQLFPLTNEMPRSK